MWGGCDSSSYWAQTLGARDGARDPGAVCRCDSGHLSRKRCIISDIIVDVLEMAVDHPMKFICQFLLSRTWKRQINEGKLISMLSSTIQNRLRFSERNR